MSFDQHGGESMAVNQSECKPDYEKQAAGLKNKLDSTTNFKEVMYEFMNENSIHRLKSVSSFAELLGGVCIIEREQTAQYKELLSIVEKE